MLTKEIDITQVDQAGQRLRSLIEEMGGVDLFVISSGVGYENPNLEWKLEAETIAVNVTGFTCMVNAVTLTAMLPKADIKLILVKGAANDPYRSLAKQRPAQELFCHSYARTHNYVVFM